MNSSSGLQELPLLSMALVCLAAQRNSKWLDHSRTLESKYTGKPID